MRSPTAPNSRPHQLQAGVGDVFCLWLRSGFMRTVPERQGPPRLGRGTSYNASPSSPWLLHPTPFTLYCYAGQTGCDCPAHPFPHTKLLQDSCSASVLQGPAGVRHCPAAALRVRSATQNCCRTAVLQVSCAPLFYWRSAPGQLPQRCPASIGGCPARWALVNVRFALQRERDRQTERQTDRIGVQRVCCTHLCFPHRGLRETH